MARGQFVAGQSVPDLTTPAGTTDDALADVGASYSRTAVNDNFRDLVEKVNIILDALRSMRIISS